MDFNAVIRPILSDKCYKCHGPDEKQRQAGLRFDLQQGAMSETESGGIAIVPGKLSSSLIIQRITADDPEERMPPVDSDKELSQDEGHRAQERLQGLTDFFIAQIDKTGEAKEAEVLEV